MLVQPEGDPGDDDQHAAGDVDGDEIVGELSLEDELHLETAVLPGVGDHIAVGALVLLQGEPGQMEARHNLDGVHVLPLVHQVVSRPAVCNFQRILGFFHFLGLGFINVEKTPGEKNLNQDTSGLAHSNNIMGRLFFPALLE